MEKIRLVTLFSGYDSQALSMNRLNADFPGFDYELVAWCEIEDAAIKAHNALFPQWADRNLGDICKVDPNDVPDCDCLTYSFPCSVRGTLIHTERGFIPIEQVTTFDRVLTHTNKYQRVLAVGSRDNAPLLKVRGMCFKDIICTPNHPFYVRKRYKEWANPTRRWNRKFAAPEWIAAENLTRDHYIGYAINTK